MLSLTEIEVKVVMGFDAEADSDLAPGRGAGGLARRGS